ncbi:Zinc finger MYND domain-containing protein 10 [Cichlidogyrus casuarinus]|uniref:Zinc finger MYND domain-containing protein 10 n=1 Tax=Cichlidogyrus casuarinus TaxID=1844966 RepID=A0ABD2QQA9_9PLAT
MESSVSLNLNSKKLLKKYILFPTEAEKSIESLNYVELADFGNEFHFTQILSLNKLALQAIACIQNQSSEYIKEYFLSYTKLDLLIKSLITAEIWRQKVLPKILKHGKLHNENSYCLYLVLNNEVNIASLLESIIYHADAMETIGESAVDFCDWIYKGLCYLITVGSSDSMRNELFDTQTLETKESHTVQKETERHLTHIRFQLSIKSIALIRYLIDHSCTSEANVPSVLPLSVRRRILITHDIPLALCHLVELKPWFSIDENKEWHDSGEWRPRSESIHKLEGQVWLSIYTVLLYAISPQGSNYDLNQSHRKQAFMRLRPYLTDKIIESLPFLGEMRRVLEQMSISNNYMSVNQTNNYFKTASNSVADLCLIEVCPEYSDEMLATYKSKWDELGCQFMENITKSEAQMFIKKIAAEWADIFSTEMVENMIMKTELRSSPCCVVCGEAASKRCSRCRQEWYCRRQCQVEHWPKHKSACDVLQSKPSANCQQQIE